VDKSDKANGTEEVIGAFVVAGGDASGILEAAEHALDLVAVPVGALVMRIGFAAIDFVGNDRRGAAP
jgi:hypothetical protein